MPLNLELDKIQEFQSNVVNWFASNDNRGIMKWMKIRVIENLKEQTI